MDLTNSTAERHHNHQQNIGSGDTDSFNNNNNNDDITRASPITDLDKNVNCNIGNGLDSNGNSMENSSSNSSNGADENSCSEISMMTTTSDQQQQMEGSSNSQPHHHQSSSSLMKEKPQLISATPNTTNYDDLFPSLPSSGSGGGLASQGLVTRKPILMSSTITQVFHIPVEERRGQSTGFGSDDTYKVLKTVMDKSGSKIEMASSKDQALTFLITGKQEAVMKAKRELHAQFQTQASVQLSVPREHHRVILGKSGTKLQELQTRTATKIALPKVGDSTTDVITITGPKEGIEKAVHEIRTVSDQLSKQAYEVLTVSKSLHPFINGPGGELVKKMLQDRGNNVRINIPPPSVHKDEISVAGEKDSVAKVCGEITRMAKELEKKITTVSVEVKKQQHRYVIGPKGNGISEIFADTGVIVEMPPSDSVSETITLRGPHLQMGKALTKVYEKANSVVSYEVVCPNWLHKHVIGRKGANIQKLTADVPKVHVEFLDESNSIKIDGPPEESDRAKEVLEEQVKELMDTMSFANVKVDPKYHKYIIGKGGSNVNKLKQETQVAINIPDGNSDINVIRIEGPKEGVMKAKLELVKIAEKLKNEKEDRLLIENRFHRQLIGQKGENIKKIREQFENVIILFPDQAVQSDVVKLRGPKQEVEACAKALNSTYQALRALNHQVKVPVFKQFNKQLELVSGGPAAAIRKIRQETDTRIDLPKPSSETGGQLDDNFVTITGKKENVEKAQVMIQKLQGELADVVSVDIIIPAKIHNAMIGARGKLIQSIMDDCGGVHIKFPEPNSGSDKVTIRGPKDDVAKAKRLLVDLSNERQLSGMTAEIKAKPEHHKFLIGRQGVNIQAVRDKTGARIIFPGEGDKDAEVITILGTKEAVAAAKVELEKRIKDLEDVVEDVMTVDPKHHRYFVAKRGEVLRNIADEFGGVVVSFPRNGVVGDKVTLRGAKDCVQGAMLRIAEMVNDLECQVTVECVIEQQHHRVLMGAKGSNIQKVCSTYDVQIKIPDRKPAAADGQEAEAANEDLQGDVHGSVKGTVPSSDIIRITGKKEKCEAAAEALRALIPVNVEVEVPFEFHRFIIGQKGAGIRQLMNSHNVNIKVPGSEEQSCSIVINGIKENVESAREDLLRRVEELEREKSDRELRSFEVKVEVKPEYHPKIIGRKGAVITQLRTTHGVNILLPKLDPSASIEEQSTIIITGYEDKAVAAGEAILKIVDEFESMSKQEIDIDHRIHAMIIGRKGAGIRQIIKDYDVDIRLPREGDPNPNAVVVTGPEDNVQACVDHLLSLNEDFLQDVIDREAMKAYEQAPLKAMQREQERKAVSETGGKGFEISEGAPWQGGSDEASFPTLGGKSSAAAVASTPVWGPRR